MKIRKNYKHDSMSISVKLPSGASLKFSVDRDGDDLELAFSNDRKELKRQAKVAEKYLDFNGLENNLERFERFEKFLKSRDWKSGREMIAAMEDEVANS